MRTLFLILLLPATLYAQSNHHNTDITQSNDMNNQTGGDISLSGDSNRAIGFGRSSFDVDINQCLGSTAWDTILGGKQKLVLNKWCAAESYDAKGLYKMAARIRCQVPEVMALFDTPESCVLENTWDGPPTDIPGTGPGDDGTRPGAAPVDTREGYGGPPGTEIALMQMEIHQEEYSTLEERLAKVETGQRAAAQQAQERRDYAEFTIQRLENDPEE